jgi:hypothetical protein
MTFRNLLVAILLGPFAVLMAHAIGDSGGCMDFGSSPLGKALRDGAPLQVEREIMAWVEKFAPRSLWSRSRKQDILNFIQGSHAKNAVCAPGALLPIAINAGNVEVTRFLLAKPLGVDPKIPRNILFFTCDYQVSMSEDQRNARIRAIAALLDSKAVEVNALRDDRYSILEECKQPELLSLYLEHGARADVEITNASGTMNILESAILDALMFDEDSSTAQAHHAVERAKLFSRALTDSIVGRQFEHRIRNSCKPRENDRIWNPRTCRELSTFIKATPGIFGEAQ